MALHSALDSRRKQAFCQRGAILQFSFPWSGFEVDFGSQALWAQAQAALGRDTGDPTAGDEVTAALLELYTVLFRAALTDPASGQVLLRCSLASSAHGTRQSADQRPGHSAGPLHLDCHNGIRPRRLLLSLHLFLSVAEQPVGMHGLSRKYRTWSSLCALISP